jgi:sugar/nucleoside kinase (ribokinase family)
VYNLAYKEARMMFDVTTLGPLNADLLISGSAPTDLNELTQWMGPSTVLVTAAGSNGYATLAFAKLGLRTGVVAMLASDPLGDMVYHEMVKAGVDVSRVARQPGTLSGIGIYMLLFGSKKRPLTYQLPTHVPWPNPLSQADQDFLLNSRHIHCGGYLHFQEMWNGDLARLYQTAHARGITTSLDPQVVLGPYAGSWFDPLREVLPYTDLLVLDAAEARRIAETDDLVTAALMLQQSGPRIVAIKNGEHGTLIFTPERSFLQPAAHVPEEDIVDAVGAGDAFDAGLIAGFIAGWPIEKAAKFATRSAASSLYGPGAVASLTSREELELNLDGDE